MKDTSCLSMKLKEQNLNPDETIHSAIEFKDPPDHARLQNWRTEKPN